MKQRKVWISLDCDYLCGSYADETGYSCVRNCRDCYQNPGRPRKSVLPEKDIVENTKDMIQLVESINIKKAWMCQCHASITKFIKPNDVVFNIDAHTDNYSEVKTKKDLDCGNWVNWAWDNNIEVYEDCYPIEVLTYLQSEYMNDLIYMFICTSPNYCPPNTDKYVMDILYKMPCPINLNLQC